MKSLLFIALAVACTNAGPGAGVARTGAPPQDVKLTWLSVTNWLVEAGDTRILLDAYVTRIDRRIVDAEGTSSATAAIDTAFLGRIVNAVVPDRRLDWVFVGQGHWDHAFDAPALAAMTGARIGGARSVCYQAIALGVGADRCRAVEGGEVIDVSPHVRVRVVRWPHGGDSATANGRRLRAPLELRAVPRVDPATGGLRPGYLEDYPSGGGSRAFLIIVRTPTGPRTIFWSNTGNPQAWDSVVPADSTFLRELGVDLSHLEFATSSQPARAALAQALQAEGLTGVDLWLGATGSAHVQQVAAVLHPAAYIPQHWDDFWGPTLAGVTTPFSSESTVNALEEQGVRVIAPANYFDAFRLDANGVTPLGDAGVRVRLGVPEQAGS